MIDSADATGAAATAVITNDSGSPKLLPTTRTDPPHTYTVLLHYLVKSKNCKTSIIRVIIMPRLGKTAPNYTNRPAPLPRPR